MVVKRFLQAEIEKHLFKGKAIILYGARQVGKTTLVREVQKNYTPDAIYFNCDEPDIRSLFTNASSTAMKASFGGKKLILIDEAQRVSDIGLTIKLLVDTFPDIQVIATGSSSFDLSNKVVEPLTGRAYEFFLPPLTVEELLQTYSQIEMKRLLERQMVFGMYPEIITKSEEAESRITHIARNYLFKDVLEYQSIRHSDALEKLAQALALQIGNEVSYTELAQIVGMNRVTVERYVEILEKAFVIFRLKPYSNNPRKELAKLRKIYFYDTGIRNALIRNFNPLNLRQDVGELWENFILSERIKSHAVRNKSIPVFFWRTYGQQEIDLVEDGAGGVSGYECKWSEKHKVRVPSEWKTLYPLSAYTIVTPENYFSFLKGSQ